MFWYFLKSISTSSRLPFLPNQFISVKAVYILWAHRRTSQGGGGGGSPPVSKIFGQNAKNSGNKETINDGIEK